MVIQQFRGAARYVAVVNMSDIIRSAMSDVPASEYTRIFGEKQKRDIRITYARNPDDAPNAPEGGITLLDDSGKPITHVTSRHKNRMYAQAKFLKEKLRDALPTRSECWNPTKKNVNKMITNEMRNPDVQSYNMAMKAIGADPKDCSIERLRRR
jgi:hypothetical protein